MNSSLNSSRSARTNCLDAVLRRADENHAPDLAAEADQPGRRDVGEVDQHARAEAEVPHTAPWFRRDDAFDRERRLADRNLVAGLHVERGQQLRSNERPVVGQERVRVGPSAFEADASIQWELRADRAELDHPHGLGYRSGSRSLLDGPDHCRRLDRFGPSLDPSDRELPVDRLARRRRPLAPGRNGHVGGDQAARFLGEYVADVLNHRAKRDDRGDPDRDAHEEEQKPLPGGARLAQRHDQDEPHVCLTTAPSRRTMRASATPASSRSCVTRTSVVCLVR
jgi:hypothetical protein